MNCYDRSTRARNHADNGECCPTLIAAAGQGVGGQRSVLAMDGDKWKVRSKIREAGFGINYENVSYTLNTNDRHIVAIL